MGENSTLCGSAAMRSFLPLSPIRENVMKLEKLKRIVLAFVAVLLFAVAGTAAAQGYIGVGAGLTAVDLCDDLFALGATSCDDEDTGLKLFGGYKFNPNFAVEGA